MQKKQLKIGIISVLGTVAAILTVLSFLKTDKTAHYGGDPPGLPDHYRAVEDTFVFDCQSNSFGYLSGKSFFCPISCKNTQIWERKNRLSGGIGKYCNQTFFARVYVKSSPTLDTLSFSEDAAYSLVILTPR